MDEQKVTHILVRLRRITTEDAFVRVPVTEAILNIDATGHHARIDGKKLEQAACSLGNSSSVKWNADGIPTIEPHPIQKPLPADEKNELLRG